MHEHPIDVLSLFSSLSWAMDLMDPHVADHQRRVAYIALKLAQEMALPAEEQDCLLLAALLHDCGIFSQQDKLGALRLDFDGEMAHGHAQVGALLMRKLRAHLFGQGFPELPDLILHHHLPWDRGRGARHQGRDVPLAAHVLHLADRVEVLVKRHQEPLGQAKGVVGEIVKKKHAMFLPEAVEALEGLARREYFWLDQGCPQALQQELALSDGTGQVVLDLAGLAGLAEVFASLVDFKSRYTAAHTAGVAVVGRFLAQEAGLAEHQQGMVEIAGLLHDLGKLAVPNEILDKPGPLGAEEFNVIKQHPYYTHRLMGAILGWEPLASWGALHHERLDGSGYPFRLAGGEIPLGARIIAVADVFTALAEDRPYRPAMSLPGTLAILNDMAATGKLDPGLVQATRRHGQDLQSLVRSTQQERLRQYRQIQEAA